MQCFLARDKNIDFTEDFNPGVFGKTGSVGMVIQCDEDQPGYDRMLSKKIDSFLARYQDWKELYVSVIVPNNEPVSQGCHGTIFLIEPKKESTFLEDVKLIVGEENVRVKVMLSQIQFETTQPTPPNVVMSTKEMLIIDNPERQCQDTEIEFPDNSWIEMFSTRGQPIKAKITIELTVTRRQTLEQHNLGQSAMYKTMFENDIDKNIEIIGCNGVPVKCHKSVICACSPVLKNALSTDMIERNSGKIKIEEMTEEGILAFLKYIYYQDEDDPNNNCKIALDLLKAGDKYNVTPDVVTAMSKIFLSKPVQWYDANVAMELYSFASSETANLTFKRELRVKAADV